MEAASPLGLAERIASLALENGIATALIGAAALAAHNYVRATLDVDLATSVNPFVELRRLDSVLRAAGLHTDLRLPDADDVLGGVLEVWEHEDEDGAPIRPVELVNFDNPRQPRPTPATAAIRDALPLGPGSALRYAALPDLVALKLYAGSRNDHADIVELLRRNPDADLDAIRATASPYDSAGILEQLIAEARGA